VVETLVISCSPMANTSEKNGVNKEDGRFAHAGASDMPVPLRHVPLTHEGFAAYGRVFDHLTAGVEGKANECSARRMNDALHLENRRPDAKLNVARFICAPRQFPFFVTGLERHAHSTQVFLPLVCTRYIVVVAREIQGAFVVEAFEARAGQGIAYAPGTWHHTLLAADSEALFACLVYENGEPGDCELVELPQPYLLQA
jgi:ureidoglycolate lyase